MSKNKALGYTPMLRQYLQIKEQNPDSVLFFRMGDFYEMFFEDATEISKFLELTLTAREGGSAGKVPMCGLPYHAAENYIARLVKGGYRVAICEQVEDPKTSKGLVRREVVKVYSAGTVLNDSMLSAKRSNYLLCVYAHKKGYALAYLDASTGEFFCTQLPGLPELLSELSRIAPSEIIYPESQVLPEPVSDWAQSQNLMLMAHNDWVFRLETAQDTLTDLLQTHSLDGFGLREKPHAVIAAGGVIDYMHKMHGQSLGHIKSLKAYQNNEYMNLDMATMRNLELLQSFSGDHKQATLFSVLDQTVSSPGGRMLASWMMQPLCSQKEIEKRLDALSSLLEHRDLLETLRDSLKSIHDLQRIIGRVNSGIAGARDLVCLANSLKLVPQIKKALEPLETVLLRQVFEALSPCESMVELFERALLEMPAHSVREGGMIRRGYHQKLDELHEVKSEGKSWLTRLQETESQKTGIKSLKIKYNNVFGYFIEVTKSNLALVPEHYIRKQTTVNSERFITSELKDKESLILGADEQIAKLEYQLFEELCAEVLKHTVEVQSTAKALAMIDVLQSLSTIALENDYVKPVFNSQGRIDVEAGRHPVVERLLGAEPFIHNDTLLTPEEQQLMIITGPNMAGKSTYIRQVALICFMAQIGSFVPAKKAELCVLDRIFTRVGASDELARGQSTFMLEMNETANILHNATKNSLIILDEVGRGTSTFDGVSIAWAVAEYVHNQLGAKTIFATHYHELTELSDLYERIVNCNVACREHNEQIVFLRKIVPGGSDKSYGIHVARLAGVPEQIISRASEILNTLEDKALKQHGAIEQSLPSQTPPKTSQRAQMSLFESADPRHQELIEKLKNLDCNQITPMQALSILNDWKSQLEALAHV